ncbi:S-adenosyl-L-methionine-dependent methyltransferase [Nemania sp. FL0031]|nr:S-adenosyl-L-methionine-dependent methyltransferase [Nemania sp. FL0031]
MASETQHSNLPPPNYSTKFATNNYVRETGQTTLGILKHVITEHIQKGASPASAETPSFTTPLRARLLKEEQLPEKISVSDNNEHMVADAKQVLAKLPLPWCVCKQIDSEDLSRVPAEFFTHSINNFSIFLFNDPVKAVKESYRTLRGGGVAVFTCWERFPPVEIVRAAQKEIRPDLLDHQLIPVPGPDFYKDGHLKSVVERGGFSMLETHKTDWIVKDEKNIEGLKEFMTGPTFGNARSGYTKAEDEKWPNCVSRHVAKEIESKGGIEFKAYIVVATKPESESDGVK